MAIWSRISWSGTTSWGQNLEKNKQKQNKKKTNKQTNKQKKSIPRMVVPFINRKYNTLKQPVMLYIRFDGTNSSQTFLKSNARFWIMIQRVSEIRIPCVVYTFGTRCKTIRHIDRYVQKRFLMFTKDLPVQISFLYLYKIPSNFFGICSLGPSLWPNLSVGPTCLGKCQLRYYFQTWILHFTILNMNMYSTITIINDTL